MTAEQFLINGMKDAGFTEDYVRMMFRINSDSTSAFISILIDFAKYHATALTNPNDIQ